MNDKMAYINGSIIISKMHHFFQLKHNSEHVLLMIDPFKIFRYRNIKSERLKKDTMQTVSKRKLLGFFNN